jgi:hypothetical protein
MATQPDQFDLLLKDYAKILPQLRGEFVYANCPLTADAVWGYLRTGKIRVAGQLLPGVQVVACGAIETTTLNKLKADLLKRKHGSHVVVTKNPGQNPGEHSLNVVNIRDKIYVVDAYVKPPVFSQDLLTYIGPGKLEVTRNADLHMVPSEAVMSFRCPPSSANKPSK